MVRNPSFTLQHNGTYQIPFILLLVNAASREQFVFHIPNRYRYTNNYIYDAMQICNAISEPWIKVLAGKCLGSKCLWSLINVVTQGRRL